MNRAPIAAVTTDPLVLRLLGRLAQGLGVACQSFESIEGVELQQPPAALVVDIEREGALEAIAGWRSRWPDALIAGFIATPRRQLWEDGLRAGYDLVSSRGSIVGQLKTKLATWQGSAAAQRIPLFAMADAAGRLGVVTRLDETSAGPLAVYHLGGKLYAAQDTCPHAGARLSMGSLEGTVITCPLHGSQFDVRTGERLRGPADHQITVHQVGIDGGRAFVELD